MNCDAKSRELKSKVYQMSMRVAVLLLVLLSWVLPAAVFGAGPIFWDWPADRSFDELELSGIALDRDGHLVSGLMERAIGLDGPEIFWRVISDGDGGFYVGTGHGGEVYHGSPDGENRLVAQLDCTEIFSLLVLPGGDLLAGCGPEGHLYRIDKQGASRKVGTVPGGYVWAMNRAADSELVWVATGSPAGLYRYDAGSDEFGEELSLAAENTLDLGWTTDGALLLATQGPGLVYRYEPGGQPRLLFETPQDEARQFISGPGGGTYLLALHAGDENMSGLNGRMTAGQPAPPAALMPMLGMDVADEIAAAALYHIGADGLVELSWSGQEQLMTAAWSPRWGWVAGGQLAAEGGQATLHQLLLPRGSQTLARWAGGDVLDILIPADPDGELIVSQAHPGALSAFGGRSDQSPVAISTPLDGGSVVQWGRLAWQGQSSPGSLRWSVRGGNRSQPDDSWTQWSSGWTDQDHELKLPASRFLQWRVEFSAGAPKEDNRQVTQVSVSAWQNNGAPVISEFQIEYLKDVNFGGMLNGADNVTQRFRSGLQAEFSRNLRADRRVGPERASLGRSVRVFTWQGSDPNGDRVTYRLEYQHNGSGIWRPISTHRPGVFETGETLASWDTSEVPDGTYEMRLIASDRQDNPAHLVLESSRELGPVVVDNTPPEISRFSLRATETGFVVNCQVNDLTSVMAGAHVVLPDGSVERLDPRDLICDSQREEFQSAVIWPRTGTPAGQKPWPVRFEVRDLGGNLNSISGEVK